jgi:hypothetical protein
VIMKAVINNIIEFYRIQAEAWNISLTNTQKALEQSEKERKAAEQIQRVEDFVEVLTMNLNDMLTKFYFLKERKSRKQELMTERQVKAITGFAVFVRTLARKVCPLLKGFKERQTFEGKIDKEIRELEIIVKHKLKEFDKALDDTADTLTTRLGKYARNIASGIGNFLQEHSLLLRGANRRKSNKLSSKPVQDIEKYFSAFSANTDYDISENLFSGLKIESVKNVEEESECLIDLKA